MPGHLRSEGKNLADWLGCDPLVFPYATNLEEDPMPAARERARALMQERFLSSRPLAESCRAEYDTSSDPGAPNSGAATDFQSSGSSVSSRTDRRWSCARF